MTHPNRYKNIKIVALALVIAVLSISALLFTNNITKQGIVNEICGGAESRMVVYGYHHEYDARTDTLAQSCADVKRATGKDYVGSSN